MTTIGSNLPVPTPLLSVTGVAPKADEPERSFIDELQSLMVPSAPMSSFVGMQAAGDPAQISLASTARVFNELGLFGTAAVGQPEKAPAGLAAVAADLPIGNEPVIPGEPTFQADQGASGAPRSILLTRMANGLEPLGTVGLPEGSFRSSLPLKVPAFSVLPSPAESYVVGDEEPDPAAAAHTRRLTQDRPVREPETAAVAVDWDDRVVTATVAEPKDASTNRLRLRDKALGLIARLGFRPATVRVGARTRALPVKED